MNEPSARDHLLRQTVTAYRVLAAVLAVIRDGPCRCECRLMAEHALAEASRVRGLPPDGEHGIGSSGR